MQRVLVADDDEGWRDLISRWLAEAGCVVKACARAKEVMSAAEKFKPQAAVLDYQLGDGLGTDLAKQLRSVPGLEDIPIVIMTTIHESMLQMRDLNGANQFIAKDQGRDELYAVLQGLLPGFRAGWTPPPGQRWPKP